MRIEIDPGSGFCFGVRNAVDEAQKSLEGETPIYCLGDIVHNDEEVARLSSLGLRSIDLDEFNNLRDKTVLIRAHGEPPSTYQQARLNNLKLIDATCPIVKKLQEKIVKAFNESEKVNGQVVIYGKPGHAEVVGLAGQIENNALIIRSDDDLELINYTKKVFLFSQTTMSRDKYRNIAEKIGNRFEKEGLGREKYLKVFNTVCGQVSNREPRLKEFSRKHDVIIFVSGRESSNGKFLYSVCKAQNEHSFLISSPEEIIADWFQNASSVGICGATSTPKWLIDKVFTKINDITV